MLAAAIAHRIRDDALGQTPLSQLLGHDPVRARALLQALARAGHAIASRQLAYMDQHEALAPAQHSASLTLADALYQQHLAGRDVQSAQARYQQLVLNTSEIDRQLFERGQQCLANSEHG